jgi:uncharacterized protein (UPF0335 family)
MMIGRNTIAGELLRGFVERMENLAAQKRQLGQDEGVVMAEAKSKGLVPAAIRFVIKKRKMKPSERQEAESMEDLYLHAMGMATDTPLFRTVGLMRVDINAREQVIEAMKQFVPANGSITVEAGGAPVRLTRDKDGNVAVTEVIEKPMTGEAGGKTKPAAPKRDVPDVDGDGAESLGRQAFKDDIPIVQNPFPFGDARRPRWDKGWRDESGGDGMDD